MHDDGVYDDGVYDYEKAIPTFGKKPLCMLSEDGSQVSSHVSIEKMNPITGRFPLDH